MLAVAKKRVWELFRELFEDELRFALRGGDADEVPTQAKPANARRKPRSS
jgi:hypothetical protein